MFYQIVFWPQVKRSFIISNKHGMHELTYELPNDLISKIKILPQNSLRMEIEPFLQCTISHKNQNLSQIYCPRLYLKILDSF